MQFYKFSIIKLSPCLQRNNCYITFMLLHEMQLSNFFVSFLFHSLLHCVSFFPTFYPGMPSSTFEATRKPEMTGPFSNTKPRGRRNLRTKGLTSGISRCTSFQTQRTAGRRVPRQGDLQSDRRARSRELFLQDS